MTVTVVVILGTAAMAGDPGDDGAARQAHGVSVLADWQALPDVAARATQDAGDGVDVTVHAWGDTARGCFLTVQSVAIPGATPNERLHSAVKSELVAGGATVSEWASNDTAESSFAFEMDTLRGSVRTLAADNDGLLHAVTAACFYNRHQPQWCAARCAELINQLEVTP